MIDRFFRADWDECSGISGCYEPGGIVEVKNTPGSFVTVRDPLRGLIEKGGTL